MLHLMLQSESTIIFYIDIYKLDFINLSFLFFWAISTFIGMKYLIISISSVFGWRKDEIQI